MAEQAISAHVTMYGWPDNDPPGAGIAYPQLHQQAGGTGTFEDPITFASDSRDFAPGTKIYVPYLQKYFIMEDYCADAVASTTDAPHVDLWAGGNANSNVSSILAVENANTRDSAQIIVNAEAGHPVNVTPFDGSSSVLGPNSSGGEGVNSPTATNTSSTTDVTTAGGAATTGTTVTTDAIKTTAAAITDTSAPTDVNKTTAGATDASGATDTTETTAAGPTVTTGTTDTIKVTAADTADTTDTPKPTAAGQTVTADATDTIKVTAADTPDTSSTTDTTQVNSGAPTHHSYWHHSRSHGHGDSFVFDAPQAGSTTAPSHTADAADLTNTATNSDAGDPGVHYGGCADHVDAGQADFWGNVFSHHTDFHI
ncbi:hypothetical protein [Methylobacterium segetis]|uniref:hypothetical protein n=1 Tax=Methylobacterium segetis TaxID=2488750 RepID=UPI001049BE83|nr:hypothetical protein [Methylobacterium segetis]